MCPLSNEMFVDPVIASDGYTYERDSIVKYFKKSKKYVVNPSESDLLTVTTGLLLHAASLLLQP